MTFLTGDLGKTQTYSRREYAVLAGLDFGDGRAATVILNHFTAKSRLGRKNAVSRYGVSEVKQVGFMGRAFVWDKEIGDEEHGEPKAGDRKPPYCVRLDHYGEIWCSCTADTCNSPTCRHKDMTVVLIDEGVFSEVLQGA
jgi:hypothetical protein